MTDGRAYSIGVDIDGVIADFVTIFRDEVMAEYGVALAESDIRSHDLYLALGVSKQDVRRLITRTLAHQGLVLYPGAAEGLAALVRAGMDVHIVTARDSGGVDPVAAAGQWLVQRALYQGVHFNRINVVAEGSKHTVAGRMSCFVDDNLNELIALAEHGPREQVLIVFDHPWNQTLDVQSRFMRVGNWSELVDAVLAASGQTGSFGNKRVPAAV